MKILNQLILSLVILVGSFFAGYFYKSYTNEKPIRNVVTTGDIDIIQHSKIKQTSRTTTFTTTATGSGEVTTTIPNPELPRYTVLLNYSLKGKVGIEGLYRINNFVIGAGINSNPDVYVSAGIMF